MKKALELSVKGNVSPNPFVGCVIVKDNEIIAEGFHEKYGEKHAEIIALEKAGEKAKDSTLYVSLEPCNHDGKTPPCTKAIIKAEVKKVVVAMKDPNSLMQGKSLKELKQAGIEVESGLMKKEAEKINESFIKFQKTKKPFVFLKAAISLDGKIATKEFDSKWISSVESRKKVHELRSKVDAILIGENTVLKDNPKLTSRIENSRNPLRVIVTTKKIPENFNVFSDEHFLIATTDSNLFSDKRFEGKVIELKKEKENLVDLKKLIEVLGEKHISSLLVEGGSAILTSFLKEKLADKLLLFVSPKILGNDSIPVFGNLEIKEVKDSIELKDFSFQKIGKDILVEGYF
ncbi:bifunctional diaminohydroxyphosphoribosylaminopyrimidine deaminase/5-amino-6-(5-phosphoribosylamino)uracil reductase RibD [Candidatus Micrarchaeota archaeon]|nr:bifunctional diaminohydroxyphosphoribosylaminopyrimidine deaminase/5-amino-6-(5-phosphoribosylamino)uracil reductase RibD [Candidatus Micrarchaeota archaeon]